MTSPSRVFPWLLCLAGCDPAGPAPKTAEPPAPIVRVAEADEAPASQAAGTGRVPVDVTLVAVRPGPEVVEVEVALPQALPPTSGLRPSLTVGTETTHRSRIGADGRLDRLVFLVPVEQYSRMSQDDGLVVRAGLFSNETSAVKPTLREAR